jgi:hypothetical protein
LDSKGDEIFILKRYLNLYIYCCAIYIDEIWNQSRCSSADEWIKKIWHIYTMEITLKNNGVLLFATTWMQWATLD